MSINRHDGSENNDNVYYTSYTQKLDQNTQLNTDVQKDINLWYTDLDPEAKAELFMNESDAVLKAKAQLSFFPTECVQLFAFYYTIDNSQLQAMENLCQIIPKGDSYTGGNSAAGLRKVTRRHLKWLYDKVDFVRIRRPKNTIKWYEVSKDELSDYLSIIQQFYGLTNFPDKEGDYYFSKKIGKWLATDFLKDHPSWDEIDLNNWGTTEPVIVKQKTILDYIIAFFQGLGKKLGSIFGVFFNPEKWEEMVNGFFDHIGGQTQFFNLDLDSLKDGSFFSDLSVPNLFTNSSGIKNNDLTSRINEFNTKVQNLRTQMMDLFNGKSLWTTLANLWNNIKTIINNIFNLELPTDDDNNN